MTLLEYFYFDEEFRESRPLIGCGSRAERTVIDGFCKFSGDIQLDEITDELVERWEETLSITMRQTYRERLLAVLRFAVKAGRSTQYYPRRTVAAPKPEPGMTLVDYFERVYAITYRLKAGALRTYRMVVRRFIEHSGQEKLDDISAEAIDSWLQVVTPTAVNNYRGCLLTILRSAKKRGFSTWDHPYQKQPNEFVPRGTGQLADFFEQRYAPERALAPRGLGKYRRAIAVFLQEQGRKPLAGYTMDDLTEFARKHSSDSWAIEALFRFAAREGLAPAFRVAVQPVRVSAIPEDSGKKPTSRSPLMEAAAYFFRCYTRIRSDKTKRQYLYALSNFSAGFKKPPTVADLTDDNVAAMMTRLNARGLAVKTVNERRGRINCFWEFLAKKGVLKEWPTVPRDPEPLRTPKAWSHDELARLFEAMENIRGNVGGVPASLWWKALHYVGWDTGERITALISCRWEFVHDDWLMIPAEVRKGKRKDAAYQLSAETVAILAELREHSTGANIWPWPFDENYLWVRYRQLRRLAGLPVDRRSSFHRLRRSVASYMEAAGGNATAAMQHESRRITDAYLDPTIVRPPQPIDFLFRPGKAK